MATSVESALVAKDNLNKVDLVDAANNVVAVVEVLAVGEEIAEEVVAEAVDADLGMDIQDTIMEVKGEEVDLEDTKLKLILANQIITKVGYRAAIGME